MNKDRVSLLFVLFKKDLTMSTLEAEQETILHRNWNVRKSLRRLIGGDDIHTVYECKLQGGVTVFYIIHKGIPVGYIHCYNLTPAVQISSTYISPDFRRRGLGTLSYKSIIDHVGTLVSDNDRSEGAEALWAKLSLDQTISVVNQGFNRFIATKK
jgi:GNAT superfamily N-acetyltransferase